MSIYLRYIDIILLAMIAGFIILRLRNILGRKLAMRARYILILMRKDLKLSIKNINVKEVRDVLEGQDKTLLKAQK